jgi:predicted metal-dependent peptidase
MDSDKAAKALARVMKARASMVLKLPFFGVLSIRLELLPSELNDTGWTDGTYLGFNPDFILGLPSIEEVKFFVAHEVLHCAGGHMWRLKGRDKQKFNIAADYTINGELVEAGFTPIKGMLLDPKYTGHSAEWIYNRLPDSLKGGKGQGNGMPGGGGIDVMEPGTGGKEAQGQQGQVQPNGSTSPPPQQQTEADWAQAVSQAGKLAGKGGADADRNGSMGKSAVDWRAALRKFFQERQKTDYSWRRPNHKFTHLGVYLPSLDDETVGSVVMIADTSGSIDTTALNIMRAEMQQVADELRPSALHIISADARVQTVETFLPGDDVGATAKFKGGGGTDFRPALAKAVTLDPAPCAIVYLTDLEGTFPDVEPEVPVLWVIPEGVRRYCCGPLTVPFGELLQTDI